jgi:hypothetical protein
MESTFNKGDSMDTARTTTPAPRFKAYYRMDRIGHAKYTINFNDGVKKNKDGSAFYDIRIFSNKKKMAEFERSLLKEGYKERV